MAHRKWKNLVRYSDGRTTREYNLWTGILRRCRVGSSEQLKNKGYIGCKMDASWEDFDIFCDWLRNKPFWNSKDHNGVWYEPEKDMFSGEVKMYSDETVVFVPNCINNFIVGSSSVSGITYNKRLGKYVAQISDKLAGRAKIHLGVFETKIAAEECYAQEKIAVARKMALYYYGKVERKVTNHLLNYEAIMNANT